MKNQNEFQPLAAAEQEMSKRFTHWEYIIDDLLDMACSLTQDERGFLLQEMQIRSSLSETVDVHPAFSLDGRLVVVVGESEIEECWLYYPNRKRIEKYPMRKKK